MARKTPEDLNLENLDNENENDDVIEYVEGPNGEFVEKKKENKAKKTVEAPETTETKEKTPKNVKEVKENQSTALSEQLTASGMGLYLELNEDQLAKIGEIKDSIDATDVTSIIEFGKQEQTGINQIITYIGDKKKTRDIDAIGEYLVDLRGTLRNQIDKTSGGKSRGIISRIKGKFLAMRDGNKSVDVNMDEIEDTLQGHIDVLSRDLEALQEVWDINQERFYELELYRRAGIQKLEEIQQEIEEKKQEFIENDGQLDPMEKQILSDMAHSADLLEKKIHDLYTSQVIAVQTAAQLQMIKKTDITLQEGLMNSIVTAIPQWRMSCIASLALQDTQLASKAAQAISDATNEMLVRNAEMLGTVTRDVAKQAERPLVESDTLKKVFTEMNDALTDAAKIAEEGKRKRLEGQKELQALQEKMLSNQTKSIEGPKEKKSKK